jgi:hypothetical protein
VTSPRLLRAFAATAAICLACAAPTFAFVCDFPTQRLVGLAEMQDRWVRLALSLRLSGPECEVVIDGGTLRCTPVGSTTLGIRFTETARGECPGSGRVTGGSWRRRAERTLADVVVDVELDGGGQCRFLGTAPVTRIGGPIPSLLGTWDCLRRDGTRRGDGSVELLRRPAS